MADWSRELQERHAIVAARKNQQSPSALIGYVKGYNPADGTVTVTVYVRSDSPQEFGWMPYMVPFTGAGYGYQVFPEVGTQVLLLSVSPSGDEYIAMGGLYNSIEKTPNPNLKAGETHIQSKSGAIVKVANDGAAAGDGLGGVALVGSAVGLGDLPANLSSTANQAVNMGHLQAEINKLRTQARADLQAFATAMVSASVTNAGSVMGFLAVLSSVTATNSSTTVKIKS